MVSTNSNPPMPMPLTVPAGHMVQQILGQDGTLQDVILALDPMAPPGSGPHPPPPAPPPPPQPPTATGAHLAAGAPSASTPVSAAPFTPVGPSQGAPLPTPYVSVILCINALPNRPVQDCRRVVSESWTRLRETPSARPVRRYDKLFWH